MRTATVRAPPRALVVLKDSAHAAAATSHLFRFTVGPRESLEPGHEFGLARDAVRDRRILFFCVRRRGGGGCSATRARRRRRRACSDALHGRGGSGSSSSTTTDPSEFAQGEAAARADVAEIDILKALFENRALDCALDYSMR